MSDIFIGRVLDVHQFDNSLDIQLVCDDSILTAVPLMSPVMTTGSGYVNMPHPTWEGNPTTIAAKLKAKPLVECYVAVAKTKSGYFALGFYSPQVNQMNFDKKNFKIDRHASDVYSTIDDNGNMEIAHPNGTFVSIAESPFRNDLSLKDFDKLWRISNNKDKRTWLTISIANTNDGVNAFVKIDPLGNIDIFTNGNSYSMVKKKSETFSEGEMTIGSTKGGVSIDAKNAVTITAPNIIINGDVQINGSSLKHNIKEVGWTHTHHETGVVTYAPD